MKILVTGVAGFIGAHVARGLLARGDRVVGLDSLNDYYDVRLKQDRLRRLLVDHPAFQFEQMDLVDRSALDDLVARTRPDRVVHLAAQAGVRYSLENPQAYVDSNVTGFLNVLEVLRKHGTEHLVFASSSSVYGASTRIPYSARDGTDHPLSLYAATKKSNELMAHTYSHLFGIPSTGLRFFTAYGPWGRPDMAPMTFTRLILAGEPIRLFNQGHHTRDFTYIDDVVEGVVRVLDTAAEPDPLWSNGNPDPRSSSAPYRVYNLGGGSRIELLHFVEALEKALGIRAERQFLPMQPGDVLDTSADPRDLLSGFGWSPATSIDVGVERLVDWYRDYYGYRN